MDSITANYALAKEFSQAYAKAATDLQNYAKNQQAPIEKLQNEIQTKYQQGIYLSQASMDADVNRAQTMAQQASNRVEARQREYDTQLQSLQMALQDSIQHFFKDYVAEKHYDAILFKSDCIYVNPALDITDEVIKGLNERYKPANGAGK
jgi:outer membrane protein